jgi:tRNA(fMet)-specific endonuclease VapC
VRRYLLDTGIASDFVHKRLGVPERAAERVLLGDRIGICTPVLGELAGGIELSQTRDRNMQQLEEALSNLRLWPFDESAAREYARLFALLRRIGRPMQQIDMQIAAVALSMGNMTVVTKDSDFLAIPGLAVENWAEAS